MPSVRRWPGRWSGGRPCRLGAVGPRARRRLLRLPILFLYLRAIRRGTVGTVAPDAMDQEIDLAD